MGNSNYLATLNGVINITCKDVWLSFLLSTNSSILLEIQICQIMNDIQITYDALQHCTALKKSRNKRVGIDCPYTGKGEEFSPTNLVEAGLGACMLISMGTYAMQHNIDLTGTKIDVHFTTTDKAPMRFTAVEINIKMPEGITKSVGKRLERAAEL